MKHEVTATDILVPVREVLNKYLEHIYDDEPPVYVCDVIKTEFNRHKIACGALGHGYNVIVQQIISALGVVCTDSYQYDWSYGIECLFTATELANFCNVGISSVSGYDGRRWGIEELCVYFDNSKHDMSLIMRAFSRIGMLRGVLDELGEDAYFYLPMA